MFRFSLKAEWNEAADVWEMVFKASAHSFKQITSRFLKLSFYLSMHLHVCT